MTLDSHPKDPSVQISVLNEELDRMRKQWQDIPIHLNPSLLLQVVGLLQLALYHPHVPTQTFTQVVAFIEGIASELDSAGFETLAHTILLDQPPARTRETENKP